MTNVRKHIHFKLKVYFAILLMMVSCLGCRQHYPCRERIFPIIRKIDLDKPVTDDTDDYCRIDRMEFRIVFRDRRTYLSNKKKTYILNLNSLDKDVQRNLSIYLLKAKSAIPDILCFYDDGGEPEVVDDLSCVKCYQENGKSFTLPFGAESLCICYSEHLPDGRAIVKIIDFQPFFTLEQKMKLETFIKE